MHLTLSSIPDWHRPCGGFKVLLLATSWQKECWLRVCNAAQNSSAHAVAYSTSGRVITGRRKMAWEIHAVVKQPQNIDA